MFTAKNVSKNLKVSKKPNKYKKTASPVPLLKHNGTGLIKEQEASYVTSNIGGTIPSTSIRTGLKILRKSGFYSPSEIVALFKSKKIDKEWSFIEYKPSDTSKLTHCYHRYPAKFIPQLVERLMDEYLEGVDKPHVNDLFMGKNQYRERLVCCDKKRKFN